MGWCVVVLGWRLSGEGKDGRAWASKGEENETNAWLGGRCVEVGTTKPRGYELWRWKSRGQANNSKYDAHPRAWVGEWVGFGVTTREGVRSVGERHTHTSTHTHTLSLFLSFSFSLSLRGNQCHIVPLCVRTVPHFAHWRGSAWLNFSMCGASISKSVAQMTKFASHEQLKTNDK